MPNYAQATIIGHAGNEPELKELRTTSVTNVSVAVTTRYKDGEQVSWYRVVFFGKLAETVQKFVNKGDPIFVSGRMKIEEWVDKNGNKRTSVEIIANEMQLLGKKEDRPVARQPVKKEKEPMYDSDIPF